MNIEEINAGLNKMIEQIQNSKDRPDTMMAPLGYFRKLVRASDKPIHLSAELCEMIADESIPDSRIIAVTT